jgi:hypothetical protein
MSFWEDLLRPLRIKWVNLALRFVARRKSTCCEGEKVEKVVLDFG